MTTSPLSTARWPILFTGFEPFHGAPNNPTRDLMWRLEQCSPVNARAVVLPTSYERGAASLKHHLETLRPQWLVMTGLNSSASHLRYEQVALNLDDASKPDNDGEVRRLRRIRESGPVGFWNGLPYELLGRLCSEAGETLESSRDAGGFVCNHVYFSALDFLTEQTFQCRAGFVHVPALSAERLERMVGVFTRFALELASISGPAHVSGVEEG